MAKLYCLMIKKGRLTIEDVPKRWRADVEALLEAEENNG